MREVATTLIRRSNGACTGSSAVACDACSRPGWPRHRRRGLPGAAPVCAGHDAVVMSEVVPVGMLFVRCAGGISHHPSESVATSDVAAAIDVLDGSSTRCRREAAIPSPRLLVRGGTACHQRCRHPDVAISAGEFVEVSPEITGTARAEIDARGLHVLPGVVDVHVHFNDPGRTDWEGWATGSAACAVGGTTTVAEMPLNAYPPTLDGPSFAAKQQAAESSSHVDFALWGGLTPINLEQMDELAARGAVGFKAFCRIRASTISRAADDATLFAGMQRAAALGLPSPCTRRTTR